MERMPRKFMYLEVEGEAKTRCKDLFNFTYTTKTQRLREEAIAKAQNGEETFMFPKDRKIKISKSNITAARTRSEILRQQSSASQIKARELLLQPYKSTTINTTVLSPNYIPPIQPTTNKTQQLRDNFLKNKRENVIQIPKNENKESKTTAGTNIIRENIKNAFNYVNKWNELNGGGKQIGGGKSSVLSMRNRVPGGKKRSVSSLVSMRNKMPGGKMQAERGKSEENAKYSKSRLKQKRIKRKNTFGNSSSISRTKSAKSKRGENIRNTSNAISMRNEVQGGKKRMEGGDFSAVPTWNKGPGEKKQTEGRKSKEDANKSSKSKIGDKPRSYVSQTGELVSRNRLNHLKEKMYRPYVVDVNEEDSKASMEMECAALLSRNVTAKKATDPIKPNESKMNFGKDFLMDRSDCLKALSHYTTGFHIAQV